MKLRHQINLVLWVTGPTMAILTSISAWGQLSETPRSDGDTGTPAKMMSQPHPDMSEDTALKHWPRGDSNSSVRVDQSSMRLMMGPPVENNSMTQVGNRGIKDVSEDYPKRAPDQSDALDANNHPPSPVYESAFRAMTIPLDATLSWMNRFTGDETFNEAEVFEPMMADKTTEEMIPPSVAAMASKDDNTGWDTTGIVRTVRPEEGKIKIAHKTIDHLGMPAMTMVFTVEDRTLLFGFERNQEVGFNVENTAGGFVITNIAGMAKESLSASPTTTTQAISTPQKSMNTTGVSEPSASATMDARGVVKTIRIEQGKVKIQHGPIERLGMPSMTMMFSVKDPALLQGVTKGAEVDFAVDNTAGGFVITNIKPVQ